MTHYTGLSPYSKVAKFWLC